MLVGAVVIATAIAGAVIAPFGPTPPAQAAVASDFDPGFIVSDANFYDGTALDATTVQQFILSRNNRCAAGATCLWGYQQSTPAMPANAYCQSMPGQASESAASIIARVGRACNISQKALLVLLQKEQSLVTANSPTATTFARATGFNCPDTAPCNPAFGSFFYQVYYAARQFQVYRAFPSSFNYRANAWNSVLYHPNAACGRSSVYIANAATAGLYIYTPYRPNAAALANLYGTGDGCSSYGNRNFWRIWTDWFGSPTGEAPTLVRRDGQSTVHLSGPARRYAFTSAEQLQRYSGLGPVRTLPGAEFDRLVDGGPVQNAVRATDGKVWLIDGSWRFEYTGCDQVAAHGMNCDTMPAVAASQLRSLVPAGSVQALLLGPDGRRWLIQGGERREVPNPAILAFFGIASSATGVSGGVLSALPVGTPVAGNGLYTDGVGAFRSITPSGAYSLPAGLPTGALVSRATRLDPASFTRLPAVGGALPSRFSSDGRSFMITDGGLLEVPASLYGGQDRFTPMPAGTSSAIPVALRQSAPHFIRNAGTNQIYLVSGGYLQPQTTADVAWIARTFGVDPRVWTVAGDGAFQLDALYPRPENLVRDTSTGTVYVVSGGQRHRVPDAEIQALYAGLGSVRDLPSAQISAFVLRGDVQRAFRGSDGAVHLVDNGARHRLGSCAQATEHGFVCEQLPVLLLSQLGGLRVGDPVLPLLTDDGGTTWFIQAGLRREVPESRVLAPYGITGATTRLSNAYIGTFAVGAPVLGSTVVTDGGTIVRSVGSAGPYDLLPAASSLLAPALRLQPASMAVLGTRGTLPLRAAADGRVLIAAEGGWLEVSAPDYGGGSFFTATPSGSWSGVPRVATVNGAHFVRERSTATVHLVSGGVVTPLADDGAVQFVARTFGVPSRVWTLADGALAGLARP